jgi:hypothetical protein
LRFYIKLQNTTSDIKEKIIQDLVNNKYSQFVNTASGELDVSVYFASFIPK